MCRVLTSQMRRSFGLPPYRYVLSGGGVEATTLPGAPTVFEFEPGQSSHEVEFRRPGVPESHGVHVDPVWSNDGVHRGDDLTKSIMHRRVDRYVTVAYVCCLGSLATIETCQIGYECFNDESSTRRERGRNVGKAVDLFGLAGETEDRVEDDEYEGEVLGCRSLVGLR